MDRETKTLETPLAKKLVIKTYMTARERESLLASFDGLEKEISDQVEKGEKPTLKSVAAAKKYMEIMVISYDDRPNTAENPIIEQLLDLPVAEFDFIVTKSIDTAAGDFQSVK